MTYRVSVKPAARKELEALPDQFLRRIDRRIVGLGTQPRPSGYVKLHALDIYRIRIGDYRILYRIDDQSVTVETFIGSWIEQMARCDKIDADL